MQQDWKSLANYGTVGLEFALSVLVGLLAGQWLDEKLHSSGWLTLIGGAFGLLAGGRAVLRALTRANREADRQEQQERAARKQHYDDDSPD